MNVAVSVRALPRLGGRNTWLIAGLGLIVTAVAVGFHARLNQTRLQAQLQSEAGQITQSIVSRLQKVEYGLRGLRGAALAAGWDRFDQAAFLRYVRSRDIAAEFPGVGGFGLARRVPRASEPEFVQTTREAGRQDFSVRQVQAHDGERVVIQHVEPEGANRDAWGLDIASEDHRREAALNAWRSGAATLTHPVDPWPSAGGKTARFLMVLPVYAAGVTPSDEGARVSDAVGLVVAPLVIDDLLSDMGLESRLVRLRISDAAAGVEFYASPAEPGGTVEASAVPSVSVLDRPVAGRTWRVSVQALPPLAEAAGLASPTVTALMGLMLTALSTVAVSATLRARSNGRELKAEQARRALALQTSRDAVITTDLAGAIVDWNEGAAHLLGYGPADTLGRDAARLLGAEASLAVLNEMLAEGRQGHAARARDLQCRHREGQDLDVSVLVVPLRDVQGAEWGMALVMRDIRFQKAAERQARTLNAALAAALREKEALLEAVKAQAIVSIADPAGRIVDVNERFCRISKFSRDELVGQDHRLINSGIHPRSFWREMWHTISSGQSWRGQVCNRAKDGSLYWVDSMVAPVVGEGGLIDHYVSIRFDISEARRTQDQLRASEDMLDRAGQLAKVGAWELDLQDHQLSWSEQTRRIHGRRSDAQPSLEEAMNYVDAEARSLLGDALSAAAERHEGWELELPVTTDDGRRIVVHMTGAVDVVRGRATRLYGAVQDVTERRAFERTLEEATARAEAASRAKSEFLANMSHEIRSPLNAMMGLTWLLRQSPLDADQVVMVDRVRFAGDTLSRTLNDVLDISRIEAGEMPIASEPIDLAHIANGVVAMLAVQAQAKGLELAVEIGKEMPARVRGDGVRVTQVLTNLVANAIKFTQAGSVRLEANWRPEGAARGRAVMRIQDTGIGIDADAQQRIFEPFVQADGSTTRRFGGSGLGLAIVRQLVQRMDGSVQVESRVGDGSCFTVEIPFDEVVDAVPDDLPRLELGPNTLLGRTILIADDSDINRDVARRILQHRGARVLLAENGAQAVETLRRSAADVDLVLMDLHMPVMDGFEATRRIRQDLGARLLPVFALSAGVTAAEREAAREAGMDDFIAKPFDPPGLLRSVMQSLAGRVEISSIQDRADAPAAGDWPVIEGIDGADVQERLGGDFMLFRSLLGRLFADNPPGRNRLTGPVDMDAVAAHAHRLAGNAGTLGMRRLFALAKDLQARSRNGNDSEDSIGPLAASVDEEIARLRRCCEHLLIGTADDAPAAEVPVAPLVQAEIDDLRALLELNNMRATERFESLAPALRLAMEPSTFEALQRDIQNLAFAQALAALAGVNGERVT